MTETLDLLSTAQAAVIVGRDVATVNRWVREGRLIPAFRFNGRTGANLFRRADIEAARPRTRVA